MFETDDGYNVKKGEFVYGINGQGVCDWEYIVNIAGEDKIPATEDHDSFCDRYGATYIFKHKENAEKFIEYENKKYTQKDLDKEYNKAIDDVIKEVQSRNNMMKSKFSYINNETLIEIINEFKK